MRLSFSWMNKPTVFEQIEKEDNELLDAIAYLEEHDLHLFSLNNRDWMAKVEFKKGDVKKEVKVSAPTLSAVLIAIVARVEKELSK